MCAARTVTTGRLVPVRAMKHKCDANLYGVVARVFLSVGTMLSGPANPQFRRSGTKTSQASFPRFWELFGYVLPKSIRQKAYEPYVDELKQDYITARANPKNRRKWARRWLWLCFFVRTFATSVTCLRLFAVDSCWKWLFALLPTDA